MSKDLRDYIVKLNDRNIQRQRETGFTLYAILGAIIYCIYFLIDNLNALFIIKKTYDYFLVMTITSNLLFALFILSMSFHIKTRKKRITKIFPYQVPLKIEFSDIPIFLTFAIISYLNFFSIQFSPFKIFTWFLSVFGVIVTLNLVSPFVAVLIRQIKLYRKQKKGHSVEKIDFTAFNQTTIKTFSISFFLYSIVLFTLAGISIANSDLKFEVTQFSLIIKYTIIFYGFLYLVKLAIDIRTLQNRHTELEDFEKEIFFEKLSDEEIAKRFEHEFDGIPFSKWLTDKQNEIINHFDTKRQEFLKSDLLLLNIDQIDKNKMPHEYIGRLDSVINEQSRLLSETSDFVQKISSAFKNLRNFGSLNDAEFVQLNYIQTLLQNNISSFNITYHNLTNKIEDRQK